MANQNRLENLFRNRSESEKIMSLFITAGFPEKDKTVSLVRELETAGADAIELGMPFSDPLADGPTIQYASKVALDQGITLDDIMEQVREIRTQSQIPIILMGYINPVLRYGLEPFFKKAAECGVDGVILPDVPPGEMPELEELGEKYNLAPVHLVAPNTPDERMREIDGASRGFVYCVSVAGVTGARDGREVSNSVEKFIRRVRTNVTRNPVLIGFGIRSHDDAQAISAEVDGYIVGSALIDYIRSVYPAEDWITKTGDFVRELKSGEKTEAPS
ncbi:tryptophan synthase subunit alpha [Balneolales bacterium ANBcel1]|nr:tryptophan synthase subunit alpha [Balneolales bacterium ANBcel1]